MGSVFVKVRFEVINCWVCGCTFAMDSDHKATMKAQEKTLFCPNGCRLGLGDPKWKKEKAQLERRLATAQRRSENLESSLSSEKRSHASTKGKLTKVKNRAANGVCPCCNRHFKNVHRHMKSQHPDYVAP